MLQEEGILPRPKMVSCLTVRNKLSKETHVLTKKASLERSTQGENGEVREPRRTALPRGSQPQFYGDGVSFLGFLWPVFLLVPPFGLIQSPWEGKRLSARRLLEGWQDML